MGRHAVRTEYLSLDTIALIDKLYPKRDIFYYRHLNHTTVTIFTYYAAMRHDPIDADTEQLIESSLMHELMHLGVTRDMLATVPPLLPTLQAVANYIKSQPETESQSQALQYLLVHSALLSTAEYKK